MSNAKHVIAVEARTEFGDNPSRRLRRASRIPAVIYSKGQAARAISLSADEWKVVSAQKPEVITLVEDGKETQALVREVQFNHLKNYVYHVDFVLA